MTRPIRPDVVMVSVDTEKIMPIQLTIYSDYI